MDIEPVSDGSFAVLIYLWWREWCLESYFQKGCFRALFKNILFEPCNCLPKSDPPTPTIGPPTLLAHRHTP